MTRPVKRMAAPLLVARLIFLGAASTASLPFAVNGLGSELQSGGDTPNPGLSPAKPKMWKVTVHSFGPTELAPPVIGLANCPGKPLTLHANIAPAPGRKLQYAWTVNAQPQGGNTPEFTFTPNSFGVFNVQVTISDVTPPPPPMQRPKHFPVRCWNPPPPPPPPSP
ncbi:MAG: PKD domain-containing protein, partial [Bryobacteraceae bacterium]